MFIFMLIFGISWVRFPAAILQILMSFQCPFWGHFEHFSVDVAKLKNATVSSEMLGLGGVGPPFWHFFCLLFECVFHVAF